MIDVTSRVAVAVVVAVVVVIVAVVVAEAEVVVSNVHYYFKNSLSFLINITHTILVCSVRKSE